MCDAYVVRICSDVLQGMQDREEPLTEKQSEEQTMRTHSVFRSPSTAEKRESLAGSVWTIWDDAGRVSMKDNGRRKSEGTNHSTWHLPFPCATTSFIPLVFPLVANKYSTFFTGGLSPDAELAGHPQRRPRRWYHPPPPSSHVRHQGCVPVSTAELDGAARRRRDCRRV